MKHRPGKARSLPPLPSTLAPPEIRLANRSVMRTSWRDPDDVTPNARRAAREITGFRAACALRQMLHKDGARSSITDAHVLAADMLRAQVDAILYGFSGRREFLPVQAIAYGPVSGPSMAAIRTMKAWAPFRSAMALFSLAEKRLLTWVVLENRSVTSWCAAQRELGRLVLVPRAMQALVGILDRLVDYYDVADDRRGDRAA
jgi:hypothetical protein